MNKKTKSAASPQRNVEVIRRKNIEDNQLFLKNLLMSDLRDDFVKSARSILDREPKKKKPDHQHEKVDRVTRYRLKVQSGEIVPHIPEWQRIAEQKKLEREKRVLRVRKPRRRSPRPSKWTLFERDCAGGNPYRRSFVPRHTKVDARSQEDLHEHLVDKKTSQ